MSLKAILFDLDDTLLWDDRSVAEAFTATCEAAVRQYPQLKATELEASVRKEARAMYESFDTFPFTKMIGINPFEALWGNFSEGEDENFVKLRSLAPGYRTAAWTKGLLALGIDDAELGQVLGELFPKERRARPIVYDDTFALLDALKGNYKLLLLTNGSPDLQKEKIAGVPKLAAYFDEIIISGQFGEGKPAISIFQHAMKLLNISPNDGLMVGDKLTTDILGSNRVGMRNVWINHHEVVRSNEIIPTYEIKDVGELMAIIENLALRSA
ncbi:HAD family hydrolase [Paenibacillus psychroresistens]|uniref:Phosphoserine phosphatase n=1 Tax=Paenibacillus psychroresistens TaxID=1778678 RepID=A0A6B8RMD3_9BACL|nr:HAD family hydrolase [Paenibacillus psychroresistens]QGQ96703.1 HAD family hydrolase [Paenibacillus psychroresistens]